MKKKPKTSPEGADNSKAIWVFTPSRTDPKDLEFILVQRQELLKDAVERVRESALTKHKHHLLFVGPRGCGKTHLVSLIVNRLSQDKKLGDRLRIAWLSEDETCTTLLELLFKIQMALERRYPGEYRANMLDAAYEMNANEALEFVSKHLLVSLGSRTLVVIVENLDAIFEGLGDMGQKQLRAFIQENPKLSIVATAQRLAENLSKRASPFFGFFQTEHLKPLNVRDATELLRNIARLHKQNNVVEFLSTSRGSSRVRALHHLSGGNHRIYIVLSQFIITRESLDALLRPFLKMVDELTPYYQERIRWLPPMQRKIVEYLCICEGTVPVKEIAKRLFATPQTISSQLQDLREKGYVEASQRGRESLYEISEPLMRICVEVKEIQSRQPLRLLVDFLRVWYDEKELNARAGSFQPETTSRAYLESAIERNRAEGNLRKQLFIEDLRLALPESMDSSSRDELLRECANLPEAVALAMQSWAAGEKADAICCLDEAITEETDPSSKAELLIARAGFHDANRDYGKAVDDYTAATELPGTPIKQVAIALLYRGIGFSRSGYTQRGMDDYTAVIGLPGAPAEQVAKALVNRGIIYSLLGDTQRGIDDSTAVIGLPGAPVEQTAKALVYRGITYSQLGDTQRGMDDYTAVIGLPGAPVEQVAMALVYRGITYSQSGDTRRGMDDYTAVIGLPGAPVEQLAMALVNRGIIYSQSGDTQRGTDDYTAVIGLPDAPVEQLAKALVYRGITYSQSGDTQRGIDDSTAVIALPDAPDGQVAAALYIRGINSFQMNRKQDSQKDLNAISHLANAPATIVVNAYLALAELHSGEGRWNEAFNALELGMECGAKTQPPFFGAASGVIGAMFSAGLSHESRLAKVAEVFAIYDKHHALSILGEGVVKHIGGLFCAGERFPSADNLEQWAEAWDKAAAGVDDFRLSIRLLRTGIDFVKAGGKDPGVLLDLTSAEREILKQALGLADKDEG